MLFSYSLHVLRSAIWYHLYSFKKVKNTRGGLLLLVKLQPFYKGEKHSWRSVTFSKVAEFSWQLY